jgi:SAM-dependent methyltransferase
MDECLLYADPSLYDLLFPSDHSVADGFYLEEARLSGGRVLELGCGSGRLTIPIARSGVDIIGADLSESMLAAARAKALAAGVAVEFVQTDMRDFELPGRFAAIFIPGNSLLHLFTVEDWKRCLACVRRHLAPSGRLVFDISKWDLSRLVRDPAIRYPVLKVGEVEIEEASSYDAAAQIRHIKWYLSAPGSPDSRVIEYSLRVVFPQELLLLLDSAGFRLEERYGEFTRVAFESSSPRQVCVCSSVS